MLQFSGGDIKKPATCSEIKREANALRSMTTEFPEGFSSDKRKIGDPTGLELSRSLLDDDRGHSYNELNGEYIDEYGFDSGLTDREESGPISTSSRFTSPSRTPTPFVNFSNPKLRPPPSSNGSPTYKLRKSRAYDQLQDNRGQTKLHRIYSENETNKFNSFNGRRMYDDDKYRPYKIKHQNDQDSPLSSKDHISSIASFSISNIKDNEVNPIEDSIIGNHVSGVEDEYIPDFDFSTAIQQWTHSYLKQQYNRNEADSSFDSSSASSSFLSRPASQTFQNFHSQVKPVMVPSKKEQYFNDILDPQEELIASKLPQDFSDLPFSVRKKVIAELSPLATSELINRVVKKKFKKRVKSSQAVQFLSSFSERSVKLTDEGSMIMDHILGKIIGFGAWGVIRECHDKNGELKAIKIIRAKSDSGREFFQRELNIWKELHHDCILPLLNTRKEKDAFFCLTNKVTGGTLFDLVSKWGLYDSPNSLMTMNQRLRIIKRYSLEIISGLIYMHSKGIVHGDIKLENILIDQSRASPKALICDFGMSLKFKEPQDSEDIFIGESNTRIKRRPSIPRSNSGTNIIHQKSIRNLLNNRSSVHDDSRLGIHQDSGPFSLTSKPNFKNFTMEPFSLPQETQITDDQNLPHSHIGSLPYAAPELLESSPPPLGPAADVWAFGIMLYTMIVGKLPFQHNYEPRLRAMISSGKYDTESLESACKGNETFIKIVKGCLTIELLERLDFNEVYQLMKTTCT